MWKEKGDMSFGGKEGLIISSITSAEVEEVSISSLVGFHMGVFGEFIIREEFSVQLEVLYSS